MTATPQERTLAAEVRGVLDGHQARLSDDRQAFLVRSESHPERSYRVRVTEVAGVVVFDCDCPHGTHRGRATVPCKHGTRAARRLEREGLLRWEAGRWTATSKAERLDSRAKDLSEDELADLLGSLR